MGTGGGRSPPPASLCGGAAIGVSLWRRRRLERRRRSDLEEKIGWACVKYSAHCLRPARFSVRPDSENFSRQQCEAARAPRRLTAPGYARGSVQRLQPNAKSLQTASLCSGAIARASPTLRVGDAAHNRLRGGTRFATAPPRSNLRTAHINSNQKRRHQMVPPNIYIISYQPLSIAKFFLFEEYICL